MGQDDAPQAAMPNRCHVVNADCLTAYGDSKQSLYGLLHGTSALRAEPVLMADGGESVPMAVRGAYRESSPPRWWDELIAFLKPLTGRGWGTPGRPVYISSSNYGIDGLYALQKSRNPLETRFCTAHGCVEELRTELGLGPLCYAVSHACVSAQLAIELASREVSLGLAERALVISFDFVGPFVAAGFHSLKILNAGFPAPFHAGEIGSIGLGDGAAWVEIAPGHGPFQIAGLSTYNEMFHFTSNEPDGSGFVAVLAPLRSELARCKPWVKGHGTGTIEPGKIEAQAIAAALPGAPLVSWKGGLGHTLGSCAAVELAIALRAIEGGMVPGTLGTKAPYVCDNVVDQPFAASDYDSVLLLCNAFGGAHGAMLLHYE